MSKVDKKRKKLQEKIQEMESELRLSLTKKDSNTKEINVLSPLLKKTKSFTINVCLVNFRLNAKKRKRRLL